MRIEVPYYLIVDVEATCDDKGGVPRDEREIIEIGAIVQDAKTFEVEGEFQSFVRPVRIPELTLFCRQLTNIRQEDVDRALGFVEVLNRFLTWSDAFPESLFCSWGNYDRGQFRQDCDFHGVEYPFGDRHFNLKAEFSNSVGSRKRFGMAGALRHLGLKLEGTHHRAIDDVRNMARIVRRICTGC